MKTHFMIHICNNISKEKKTVKNERHNMLDKIFQSFARVRKDWKILHLILDIILAQALELLLQYICDIITRKIWLFFFPGSALPW